MSIPDFADALIPTVVINLRRRPDRRQRMEEILANHPGLAVTFLDAVDGQDEDFRRTNAETQARTGLGWGEIACFRSHQAVWEWASQQATPWVLVLEDDATLAPQAAEAMRQLIQAQPDADIVRVGGRTNLIGLPLAELPIGAGLFMPIKAVSLTTGYALRVSSTRSLGEALSSIHCAIDTAFDRYWFWGLRILCLAPLLALAELQMDSDIAQDSRQNPRKINDPVLKKMFSRRLRYSRITKLYFSDKTPRRPLLPSIRRYAMRWGDQT